MPAKVGNWDAEVDLLVFGSGAGGMTAALVGALEGLTVKVCEKAPRIGGTTATSGGAIWIVGSSHAREAGADDTIDEGRRYLQHELGEHYREDLAEAFLESGPTAIDYLAQRSDVLFELMPIPDYHSDAPGGTISGRVLSPLPFDGRELGADFEKLQPPMRRLMILGGMMVNRGEIPLLIQPFSALKNFKLAIRLLARHFLDRLRYSRGTRLLIGNALTGRLFLSLKRQGVDVQTEASLEALIIEDRRIIGAATRTSSGVKRIHARRGVILATGGPAHDFPYLQQALPDFPHEHTLAFGGNTGDGHRAAQAAGALIDNDVTNPAIWTPASIHREKDGHLTVFPYGYLDRGKPGAIAIDSKGRRFVNEANSYHDVVVSLYANARRLNRDHRRAYLVTDSAFLWKYGIGIIPPRSRFMDRWVRAGYLVKGNTIEELANAINVDPAALQDTVKRHNTFCTEGKDPDYGKGDTAFNRFNGDPQVTPNPCLAPIDKAPFYALPIHPASLGMSLGLKTDGNARVLNADGVPISGLYAVGNEMASMMRGHCPAGGITLGPAIVFAYRAALHAAATH